MALNINPSGGQKPPTVQEVGGQPTVVTSDDKTIVILTEILRTLMQIETHMSVMTGIDL